MSIARVSSLAIATLLIACAQGTTGGPDRPPDGKIVFTGDKDKDWAQITDLENEAKAIVKTDGCDAAAQCRTAPVGSRACGGPRYYLVYCSKTTDSAALFRKLEQVAAAEAEFNTRYQVVSTCEFRTPPQVGLVAGACQAQTQQSDRP